MIRPFKLVAIGIFIFLLFKGVGFISGDRLYMASNVDLAFAQEDPNFDANLEENVTKDNSKEQISKPDNESAEATKAEDLPIEFEQGNIESGTVEIPISEYKALKTLSKRRKELITLENTIKMKQELVNEAQAKLNKKIEEFNAQKSELVANAEKINNDDEADNVQQVVKNLVTTYETMKAKDAARIFNDMDVMMVYQLIKNMDAKKVSAIISKMDSKNVEAITRIMLSGVGGENNNELPQIGR